MTPREAGQADDGARIEPAGARNLRVLFVVPHPVEGPSSRFRVYQFLPFLRANGIEATVAPLLPSSLAPIVYRKGHLGAKAALTALGALRRLRDTAAAARHDIVYVLREAFPFGPPLPERLMGRLAGRLVFDFDDAVYAPSSAFANPLDRLRDWTRTQKLIARADRVVAGSRHLAAFAARFQPRAERITVLPTVVDTAQFRPRPEARDPKHFTVGWIGTPRGTAYLHPLKEAMQAVHARLPAARFLFVGAEPFDCGAVPVEFRPWRLDREIADIQAFDAGIMPLFDDEEARGKCGFKIIEYMSCGVPVLCSPVGANTDIVEEGRTGLFARSPQEWADGLLAIAADDALRVRLAALGRQRAEDHFSLQATAPKLLAVLRAAAGPAPMPGGWEEDGR